MSYSRISNPDHAFHFAAVRVALDLARAALAAAAAGVLPGYFWALVLRPAAGLAERLAYSTVLSMASVPAVALGLAKLAGPGVTLWVALGSVALVFASGVMAYALRGAAPGQASPVLPRPSALPGAGTLALIAVALAAAVASMLHMPTSGLPLIAVAAALAAAGAFAARAFGPAPAMEADRPAPPARTGWRTLALAIVLGLVAVRAYVAVIRFDWPYVRGGDQFSYAVMAEQMLSHGSYSTFFTYPPGFSTLTAVICRLSGLAPLALFPVLAPSLLVLAALGAYALAARLWGWDYGVVAAALTGLVLAGAHTGLAQGRYPDLAAAYFLMVMLVAALITLYESPSVRSGLLVTVVGASVVLYHPVVSMYLALLLALVAVIGLPYLLRRGRRHDAGVLLLTLISVTVLSACYAAYTYNLGQVLAGSSTTATAVTSDLGTQPVPAPAHLLTELGPAIVWLGVFGTAALAFGVRYLRTPAQVLTALTVLGWCVLMYAGSRTALDGFPQRFERDLGAPLSVAGALGAGIIGQSVRALLTARRTLTVVASLAATALLVVLVGLPVVGNLLTDSNARGNVLSHAVATAGEWLRQHNTGGTIISTPGMNHGITNRAVLALGGYTGLQSYYPRRLKHPRSLPPAGRQPLIDSAHVLSQPASCQSADIVIRDDVRYVVLYKFSQQADLAAFSADPRSYRPVFEDSSVIIYAPTRAPCR